LPNSQLKVRMAALFSIEKTLLLSLKRGLLQDVIYYT